MAILLLLVPIAGGLLIRASRACPANSRMPLVVALGSYLVTTFLGALLTGLFGVDFLDIEGYGLDLSVALDVGTAKYWLLLFAPWIGIAGVIAATSPSGLGDAARRPGVPPGHVRGPVSMAHTLLVFGLLAAYCVMRLRASGNLDVASTWRSNRGDFESLMFVRDSVTRAMGTLGCGLIYTALPCLSFVALFEASRLRSRAWAAAFLGCAGTCVFLSLASAQKSLVMLYVGILGVGVAELGWIRVRTLFAVLGGMVVLLTLLQSYFIEDWDYRQSVLLMLLRVSTSFPYYASLYPRTIPYQGIDIGLHILGMAPSPRDNLDVFNSMYPGVRWLQGSVAAPAHMRAYSQGGVAYAMLVSVGIGFAVAMVMRLRARARSAIGFAFYLQSLVTLYYLSQIAPLDTLLTSYGMLYALFGLGPLWLLESTRAPATRLAIDPRNPNSARRASAWTTESEPQTRRIARRAIEPARTRSNTNRPRVRTAS
ncbi:MAG: hypothetical protein FJ297_07010 [Planctomycetes bacterium]|nr:hypothetical protein [Planctomycetota bacterium]